MTRPRKHPASTSAAARGTDPDRLNAQVWELLRTLVMGGVNHDRMLELYYWSQEPGLLEIIRAILALPPDAQEALSSFLAAASPASVTVTQWPDRLVLSAGERDGRSAR
jgi:hypothetical protein